MKMVEPSTEYAQQILRYKEAFVNSGSMDGVGALRDIEDPYEWIWFSAACKNPDTVPEGLVSATQYMLVREEDKKILGMLQLRHRLNNYLEKYGGHIGYSVAPDERRKGYASYMLKEALTVCKKLGIKRVLITCLDSNEASRRTILKNGGVYESTVYEPDKDTFLERYWIDLSK